MCIYLLRTLLGYVKLLCEYITSVPEITRQDSHYFADDLFVIAVSENLRKKHCMFTFSTRNCFFTVTPLYNLKIFQFCPQNTSGKVVVELQNGFQKLFNNFYINKKTKIRKPKRNTRIYFN
jgi:hypothetical protein